MQGMSVTEISQYRNRSAKTISHQKKQLFEKLGIQSDITFWRDIFFQYNPEIISATGNNSHKYINDNHYHHIVTPEAISLALENHEFKPWIQPVFCAQTGVLTGCEVLSAGNIHKRELSHRISLFLWRSHLVLSS